MPVVIDLPPNDASMTLEEYVACLDDGGFDLADPEQLVLTAPHLKRLASNKGFLLEVAFAELVEQATFQSQNRYAPEVLLLHDARDYFVRANIWKPISSRESHIPDFRYDVCHDHNFDILTVGYFGPGYRSRSYVVQGDPCKGAIGDIVRLSDAQDFTLSKGTVALYRAKLDVHRQMPPESLSVSINLIPRGASRNAPQFQIDEGSGAVVRYLNFTGAELAVKLVGLLGKKGHLDVLQRLAAEHPNAQTRAAAIVAQCRIAPELCEQILSDESGRQPPLVRHIVAAEIASDALHAAVQTITEL